MVPLKATNSETDGGMSVTVLRGQMDFDELVKLIPNMQETAKRVAADTDDWRFPETCEKLQAMGT